MFIYAECNFSIFKAYVQVPQSVFENLRPDQDPESELVRHFLIECFKEKGVRISGDDR